MTDFDRIIPRVRPASNGASTKTDGVIAAWVADMDFAVCDVVDQAIKDRLARRHRYDKPCPN